MKKFAGIELCRFLCALAVILFHYKHFFCVGLWSAADQTPFATFPLADLLAPFYRQGDFAVRLFWAISGFVFFWKYAEPIHRGAIGGGRFFVWRLARLYPLHLLTLLTVILLQAGYWRAHGGYFIYRADDLTSLNLQLLMASNWLVSADRSFNGPIWSVSVEVLTYGAFFALARLWRLDAPLRLTACLAALAALVSPVGAFVSDALTCALMFFGGGYVQHLVARLSPAARRPVFWFSVASAVAMTFVAFRNGIADENPSSGALVFLALAIVATFALIEDALPLNLAPIAWLGDLTYGSYLWHFPMQLAIVLALDHLGQSRELMLSPFALLLWLGATFAVAAASHACFERPAQKVLRAAYLARVGQAAPEALSA